MTYKELCLELRDKTVARMIAKMDDPEVDQKWGETAVKYLKYAGIIALEQDATSQAKEFLEALPTFRDPDSE